MGDYRVFAATATKADGVAVDALWTSLGSNYGVALLGTTLASVLKFRDRDVSSIR